MKNHELNFEKETHLCEYALAIKCPNCGEAGDIHPISAAAYMREEDSKTGNYARVTRDQVETVSGGELPPCNPSERRDGFTLLFECWECDRVLIMDIFQHKGPTYLSWSVGAKRKRDAE
jgi:hypothetical protein